MKISLAELHCIVVAQSLRIKELENQMAVVQRRSIYAANHIRRNSDEPVLPRGYEQLTGEAKTKADESIKRREYLRKRNQQPH